MSIRSAMLVAILTLAATPVVQADIWAKAAREAAEYVMKKFGAEAVQEGAEAFSKRVATAAARHGDGVFSALRRVGPKALGLADDAGEQAPKILKLLSRHGDDAAIWVAKRPKAMSILTRYGDDAAEALIKHKGVAEPLIDGLGGPAVKALGAVGPQGGRRMAMMLDGGEMVSIGRTPELMGVIARHGDGAMNFIWRNKGSLAVATTLTAFLADPEPFINGTSKLGDSVAEHVVKPVVHDVVKPVVQGTVSAVSTLLWTLSLIFLAVSSGGIYLAVKHPETAVSLGKVALGCVRARNV